MMNLIHSAVTLLKAEQLMDAMKDGCTRRYGMRDRAVQFFSFKTHNEIMLNLKSVENRGHVNRVGPAWSGNRSPFRTLPLSPLDNPHSQFIAAFMKIDLIGCE